MRTACAVRVGGGEFGGLSSFELQGVTSSGEVSEVRDLVAFWGLEIGGQRVGVAGDDDDSNDTVHESDW
jgi:hypothetical protein